MATANFKSSWDLSDVTKAKWMNGGGIRLERKKRDILGRLKGGVYKVYIKPSTYMAILEKREEIERQMRILSETNEDEDGKTFNLHLYGNAILQLSLFQRDPEVPELVPYYGLHLIDSEGVIISGGGLNFSEQEWSNFLSMLMTWRDAAEQKLQVEKEQKIRLEKKRKIDFYDGEENADAKKKKKKVMSENQEPIDHKFLVPQTPSANSSVVPKFTPSTSVALPNPETSRKLASMNVQSTVLSSQRQLGLDLYGWEWCLYKDDGTVITTDKTQGGWFVDPKYCLEEAMKNKPNDGRKYKINTIRKKYQFDIDNDMFDTVVGKLIEKNLADFKEKNQIMSPENVDDCDGDDYDKYGLDILAGVSFGDIFEFCKKAIRFYQSFTEADNNWLMNAICEYTKDESILFLLKNNYLNKYFAQMFDFLK